MFHLREIAVLFLASLWLVQGQPGTVRQGEYDVLRNSSGGPIVCAMDQPQLVRTDTRSRLHCSTTCLQNNQCLCFNYKDSVSAGSGIACEHFDGYPFNFTVNSACRHYAVKGHRPNTCYGSGVAEGMAPEYLPRISSENCGYPFTYYGARYHSCVENLENATGACERWGCYAVNYTAAVCAANIDYEEENETITLTVPTQGSVPVLSVSGWIFIMHRVVASGFDYHKVWNDYKNGLGSSGSDDFWLGLERVHLLTTSGSYRLRLEWQELVTHYWMSTEYWLFYIDDEVAEYTLHVSGHVQGDDGRAFVAGSAYDVLGYIKPSMGVPHDGMKFSTYDNDNDLLVMNCANFFGGGGWHLKCSIWGPFVTSPMWYSPPHDAWQPMESINMMIKLQ